MLWIVAAALPLPILAQETKDTTATPVLPFTRSVLENFAQQVQDNQTALDSLRAAPRGSDEATDLDLITSQPGATASSRSRDVGAAEAEVTDLDFPLTPDATLRVRGSNAVVGLVLNGKWITDYARLIKLAPEYEKTLASYRSQAELHKQIVAELEGLVGIKDQKIAILNEKCEALEKRGDLYKKLYESSEGNFLGKIVRKLAFPAGLALGVFAGVAAANAAN